MSETIYKGEKVRVVRAVSLDDEGYNPSLGEQVVVKMANGDTRIVLKYEVKTKSGGGEYYQD